MPIGTTARGVVSRSCHSVDIGPHTLEPSPIQHFAHLGESFSCARLMEGIPYLFQWEL